MSGTINSGTVASILDEVRTAEAMAELDGAIEKAASALMACQAPEGHWCFELEADCTIPAEYILMMHFLDEVDEELQRKLAVYLREHQQAEGGWPLYHGGEFDLSCSVKAYYALKLAGDDTESAHMHRAREAILKHGGAARANVFTRITLALFGQVPWRAVPFVPVELVLLPKWSPFHLSKVSYWSRTVMVPLLILCSMRAQAINRLGIGIRELFVRSPYKGERYFQPRSLLNRLFLIGERIGRTLEPMIPRGLRAWAIRRAERWFVERLNGRGGLGAIFPAMVNAYEALVVLGYPADHPLRQEARRAIDDLLVVQPDRAYCQPCVSPVWDTGLAALALQEVGDHRSNSAAERALDWLSEHQLLDEPGDWRISRPELPGGGWAFQYKNDYYPDVDDTSVVAWAMHRQNPLRYAEQVRRAANWIVGMQSSNGGFAAFDVDNTSYYLNDIPFADHGALLDPPTSDVSARCVSLLCRLTTQYPQFRRPLKRTVAYLREKQLADGSWFGRWGTNYIYGTWSSLEALGQAGFGQDDPMIRRAVEWLKVTQREDGGWGETNDSYADEKLRGCHHYSTAFQTAWALLGLMAVGEVDSEAVRRGIQFLLNTQNEDGFWRDDCFTAPGFPRVFYLKYHGYDKYFPLWALARYRNRATKRYSLADRYRYSTALGSTHPATPQPSLGEQQGQWAADGYRRNGGGTGAESS